LCLLLFFVILALFLSCGLADSPPEQTFGTTKKIYWTIWDDDGIFRIKSADINNPEAASQVVVETGDYNIGDIEIDSINKKMYWIDISNDRILRANLDGSVIEELISKEVPIIDLCIDTKRNKLYWTESEFDNYKIRRANLDGSDPEDFLVRTVAPYYLATDLELEKIYWSETSKIYRAHLDGTGIPEQVLDEKQIDFCMASNIVENKIYYSFNVGNSEVERADLITKDTETLYVANIFINAMAIDIVNFKLYFHDTGFWDENADSYITQSNLDGTGVTHLIANEENGGMVYGIAFEYE